MVAISTWTSPFLSCQIWAVPIGVPLALYMMAFAAATEFCIRCADEQAPQNATMAAMFNSRDQLGIFIFDSGVSYCCGLIPNLELRPDDDRRAILHAAGVLDRRAGSGINLDTHNFIGVDEVVDVPGRRRLPWHVVNVILHASTATREARCPPRAAYLVAVRPIVDAKARDASQNVGESVRMHVLELIRPEIVSHSRPLPHVESHLVEAGRTAGGNDNLSLIHISEPTRLGMSSYAVFCLKK